MSPYNSSWWQQQKNRLVYHNHVNRRKLIIIIYAKFFQNHCFLHYPLSLVYMSFVTLRKQKKFNKHRLVVLYIVIMMKNTFNACIYFGCIEKWKGYG